MNSNSGKFNPPTWPEAELLIDAHFDELSENERQALESSFARNPGLRSCLVRIGRCLSHLKYWAPPPPSDQLADRVLARLQLHGGRGGGRPWVLHEAPAPRRGFSLNWHELGAIAACLAVFVGVGTLTFSNSRGDARRLMCAGNLGDIYRGTAMYAASFGGLLPNAGSAPNAYWLRNAAASDAVASNSRHQYLLLLTGWVPKPQSFVCPSRASDMPMQREDIAANTDFPDQNNCSYDAQNLSGPFVALYFGRHQPYQSDANPLFDSPGPDTDPRVQNSFSHGLRGQNVLSSNGSVMFLRSPVVDEDNIWQAGSRTRYQGNETPASQTDAFLVPGAKRE